MKRVIYKIVGVNGLGKPKLVYIGQTTNFERRMKEHKEKFMLVLARQGQTSMHRKYTRLRKHFQAGRVYFEKLEEGEWSFEEALIRETETILEYRKRHRSLVVLNEVDSPHDGQMPEGRLIWDRSKSVRLIRVFAGLMSGSEAVLIVGEKEREIVKVTHRVEGPERGLEVWTFVRSGERWEVGKMPRSIAKRVYRGRLLQIYKKRGKELASAQVRYSDRAASVAVDRQFAAAKSVSSAPTIPESKQPTATLAQRQAQSKQAIGNNIAREKARRLRNQTSSKAVWGTEPGDEQLLLGVNRPYESTVSAACRGRRITGSAKMKNRALTILKTADLPAVADRMASACVLKR